VAPLTLATGIDHGRLWGGVRHRDFTCLISPHSGSRCLHGSSHMGSRSVRARPVEGRGTQPAGLAVARRVRVSQAERIVS